MERDRDGPDRSLASQFSPKSDRPGDRQAFEKLTVVMRIGMPPRPFPGGRILLQAIDVQLDRALLPASRTCPTLVSTFPSPR